MNRYELEICRDDRLWCRIIIDTPWAADVVSDLDQRFPASEGYSRRLFQATESRRLLESSADGVRLIALDYTLEEVHMPDQLP